MKEIKYFEANVNPGPVRSAVGINIFLMILLVSISFTPIISRTIPDALLLLIWGAWLVSSLSIGLIGIIRNNKHCIVWWLLYVVWIFFSCMVGHSDVSLNFLLVRIPKIYTIPFMLPLIICGYNLKEKYYVWKFMVILLLVNLIHNIYLGIINPDVFRALDGLDLKAASNRTNAGGTGFVLICLFSAAAFYFCHKFSAAKATKLKYLIIALLFVFYITVINTRATIVIMLVLFLASFVFDKFVNNRHRNKRKKRTLSFIWVCAGLAVILIWKFTVPFLQEILLVFEGNQEIVSRFSDILLVLEGDSSLDTLEDGSLAQRYILWMTSINTFLSSLPNFLIGIGEDVHGYEGYELIKSGVGCHSEYFDLAAKYGLLGVILINNSLKSFYGYITRLSTDSKKNRMFLISFIIYIIYGFINLNMGGAFYIILILIPISFVLIENNKI